MKRKKRNFVVSWKYSRICGAINVLIVEGRALVRQIVFKNVTRCLLKLGTILSWVDSKTIISFMTQTLCKLRHFTQTSFVIIVTTFHCTLSLSLSFLSNISAWWTKRRWQNFDQAHRVERSKTYRHKTTARTIIIKPKQLTPIVAMIAKS